MAYRRHLGEDQPSSPRTPACAPEEKGPKRDRKGTLSPARAWLIPSRSRAPGWAGKRGATMVARRSKRTQALHPGGHRGLRAQSQGPQRKVMDWDGIKTLLQRVDEHFPRLSHLWVDAGYRGEDKSKEWVERVFGWSVDLLERPKKPAPKEVL